MNIVLKGVHPAAFADVLAEKLPLAGVTGAKITALDGREPPETLAAALAEADVVVAMRWQPPLPRKPCNLGVDRTFPNRIACL